MDLKALIPANSSAHLLVAFDIKNQGQIVGQAYDQVTGNTIAFIAASDCLGSTGGRYGRHSTEALGVMAVCDA